MAFCDSFVVGKGTILCGAAISSSGETLVKKLKLTPFGIYLNHPFQI